MTTLELKRIAYEFATIYIGALWNQWFTKKNFVEQNYITLNNTKKNTKNIKQPIIASRNQCQQPHSPASIYDWYHELHNLKFRGPFKSISTAARTHVYSMHWHAHTPITPYSLSIRIHAHRMAHWFPLAGPTRSFPPNKCMRSIRSQHPGISSMFDSFAGVCRNAENLWLPWSLWSGRPSQHLPHSYYCLASVKNKKKK